ncbi:MAG: 5-bromo-4-chloroindolyl phosphate hydrolysis family protein [Amylibacter sp.]|nr:5-bromo-4-chloroindolyl phosphate hydrolysis family protein [Amylibacter sp.]
MTQRYGGKFSPQGAPDTAAAPPKNRFRGKKAYQSNIRAKLLFLIPLPLLFSGIGELKAENSIGMIFEWGALAALLLAAWLLRDGLEAEATYNARKVARPPAIPRKIFASVLTGAGVTLAAFGGAHVALFSSLVFGAAAAIAHSLSFGLDPMRRKGMEGFDAFENDRVVKAVERAEKLLAETISASHKFNDRALEGRIESLASTARDMFRTVEEDPRDLARARKFMGVYLKGARDATIKFADLYARKRDTAARADYEALLSDLEQSFVSHQQTLLLDDRSDLDVEIEVLRDRLKQEGLTAKR